MKTTVSLFVLLSIIATGLVMHFVYLAKYDDPAIEYGYYGQFNRVQRNINEIPSVEIIDSWKHEDVTLEDFGFTIRIADGPERKIFFSDESPQKALKDDRKIKDFILSEYSQKEHD